MDYLHKWKCFKVALAVSIQLGIFGQVARFKKGGNKANCGEPGSRHGAGNHSVISAHLCTQISSCATPGTWIYMKVSLITISVGGLVHPVSPKNKGVDSQTQVDESRKAELVTPWLFFTLQGLPLPRPGRQSCVASRPEQPQAAEQGQHRVDFGLLKYRQPMCCIAQDLHFFLAQPTDLLKTLSWCSRSSASPSAAPGLCNGAA